MGHGPRHNFVRGPKSLSRQWRIGLLILKIILKNCSLRWSITLGKYFPEPFNDFMWTSGLDVDLHHENSLFNCELYHLEVIWHVNIQA